MKNKSSSSEGIERRSLLKNTAAALGAAGPASGPVIGAAPVEDSLGMRGECRQVHKRRLILAGHIQCTSSAALRGHRTCHFDAPDAHRRHLDPQR